MGEVTKIGWTDATANFVIGCTKVGPGCDGCSAEQLAKQRFGIAYGPGEERRITKSGFKDPLAWNRRQIEGKPSPKWIFACSLSDFFDNEWPLWVREKAWETIRSTPALRWQIVTKRIGNAHKMLAPDWHPIAPRVPGDLYRHVGIIATVCDQSELVRDFQKLHNLKQFLGVKWIGLSVEPMLGRIALGERARHLDWVIIGGESTQGSHYAREFNANAALDLLLECAGEGVPCFVKQMGHKTVWKGNPINCFKITDIDNFPPPLQVQQMPRIYDQVPA